MKYLFLFVVLFFNQAFAAVCPTGTNTGGKGCVATGASANITAHTVCKRVTNSSSTLYFIPMASAPEWTAFINNSPTGVALGACDCAATLVNWTNGSTCSSNIALGTIDEVRNVVANNPMLGNANFKCLDGGWVYQGGGSCALPPNNCVAATVNWSVGGKNCTGTVGATNHGVNANSSDATSPVTGNATFQCNNGSYVNVGGDSCVESCSGGSMSWSGGGYTCDANAPALANGASSPLTDSSGGDTGTATATCNNGVMSLSAQACSNNLEANCTAVGGSFISPNKCQFSGGTLVSDKIGMNGSRKIQGDSHTMGGSPAGITVYDGPYGWGTSILYVSGKLNANFFCKKVIANSYATTYTQATADLGVDRVTYKTSGDSNGIGWNWANNPYVSYNNEDGTGYVPVTYPANQDLSSVTCCLDTSCPRLVVSSGVTAQTCANVTWSPSTFNTDAYSSNSPSCTIVSPNALSVRHDMFATHGHNPVYYSHNTMWGLGNTAGAWQAPMVQDVKRAAGEYCKQNFGPTAYAERWVVDWSGEDEAYYAVWIPAYNKFTFDYTGNAGRKNLLTTVVCRAETSENDCQGEWGPCSEPCGSGYTIYDVTKPATGGAACAAADGDFKLCNQTQCPGMLTATSATGATNLNFSGYICSMYPAGTYSFPVYLTYLHGNHWNKGCVSQLNYTCDANRGLTSVTEGSYNCTHPDETATGEICWGQSIQIRSDGPDLGTSGHLCRMWIGDMPVGATVNVSVVSPNYTETSIDMFNQWTTYRPVDGVKKNVGSANITCINDGGTMRYVVNSKSCNQITE